MQITAHQASDNDSYDDSYDDSDYESYNDSYYEPHNLVWSSLRQLRGRRHSAHDVCRARAQLWVAQNILASPYSYKM